MYGRVLSPSCVSTAAAVASSVGFRRYSKRMRTPAGAPAGGAKLRRVGERSACGDAASLALTPSHTWPVALLTICPVAPAPS